MKILDEMKERLSNAVKMRNDVEKKLLLSDEYLKYLELQEEIAEVSKAVKALEHHCSPNYGLMQQAQINRGNY